MACVSLFRGGDEGILNASVLDAVAAALVDEIPGAVAGLGVALGSSRVDFGWEADIYGSYAAVVSERVGAGGWPASSQ